MKTLLGLLLLVTSCAQAANLELGISQTSFGSAGDNIWYDQTYPHSNSLRVTGASVGLSGDLSSWYGWRATAIYFGHPHNSAVWPDDADYFAKDAASPIYRGEGSGDAYGMTLAPVFFHAWEDFRLEGEAGVLAYSARWREHYQGIEGGPWTEQSQGWHTDWTPYFGITAKYDKVFLSYRKYRDIWAQDAVFGNAAKQLTVGLSLPF